MYRRYSKNPAMINRTPAADIIDATVMVTARWLVAAAAAIGEDVDDGVELVAEGARSGAPTGVD